MIELYDINDYLKDDKELQKAVIRELLKELSTQQGTIDAYKMSENEANEIIAELKAENERLKAEMTELEEKFLTLNGKSYSYYTTLQEIKTIAERNIFLSPKLLEINGDIGQIQNIAITQILALITKAEEE